MTTGANATTTCTGTYGGDTAWNPWTKQAITQQPAVTVSQTKDLTDQMVHVTWQYFTPSLNSGGFASGQIANWSLWDYPVFIYQCRGTNPPVNVNGLNDSCYVGNPPEQGGANDKVSQITLAPGATGGVRTAGTTGGDESQWTGQADFHIEAGAEENSFLGCDFNSPCSLVVLPNWGGQPGTTNTDTSNCENHNFDLPPSAFGRGLGSGACAYADRIVVPLTFTRTPSNCPQKTPQFYASGSPMLQRAMNEWLVGSCTGTRPLAVNYAFEATENLARQEFLQGSQAASARTDMALVTLPPDAGAAQASNRKFTYAPLANSAVTIAYYLDDILNKGQINSMVLNARLAAKLLTESYSLGYDCVDEPNSATGADWPPLPAASSSCDPAVSHNPHTLFDDPEFLSLNKSCDPTGQAQTYSCASGDFPDDSFGDTIRGVFLPTTLLGDSDLSYQLTQWIASNQDAMNFINGQADPLDGMHVNLNYWKNAAQYPTESIVPLDNGTTYPDISNACTKGQCGSFWDQTMQAAWNPQQSLNQITANLLLLTPTALSPLVSCPSDQCTANGVGFKNDPLQVQAAPDRELLSELDLGDAASYLFPTAAVVNAAGKPVTPTKASVEAAVADMKTNPDGITQYADEASTDKAAYPLAMVDYAMVPTCGLKSAEASAISEFLTRVATTGQTPGVAPGDLAPGYYPLTSKQKAQTLLAAKEVQAQDCKNAPPDTTVNGGNGVNDVGPSNGAKESGPGSAPHRAGKAAALSGSPRTAGTQASTLRNAAFGEKSPDSPITGILLLLAMICGSLAVVGAPTAWLLTATGKWPVIIRLLHANHVAQALGRLFRPARRI